MLLVVVLLELPLSIGVCSVSSASMEEASNSAQSPSTCKVIVVSFVFLLAVISAISGVAYPFASVLSGVLSLHEWHTMVVVIIIMANLIMFCILIVLVFTNMRKIIKSVKSVRSIKFIRSMAPCGDALLTAAWAADKRHPKDTRDLSCIFKSLQ